MKLLDNIPSQEWVNSRQFMLGGSEIAAALGKSPYQTPFQLYLLKTGRREPQGSTPITEMGHILEPVCAEKFTKMTGLKVRNISEPYEHPEYSFLRGNIDRQIVSSEKHPGSGVLEIKTTNSFLLRNEPNAYPLSWEYQIQHYLMLTGYQYAYLQIMERDTGYFHDPIYIERNEELIAINTQKVIEWWKDHIIADVPPDATTDEDLMILFPFAKEGETIEANPKLYAYYDQLRKVRERLDEYKTHKESLEHLLKEELGAAERMVLSGRTLLSWRNSTQRRFDTTTFKKEYPQLYKHFLKETTTRRFTFNP
ncbi:MAG: lambda-exonuclease family protein [Balneola sp.]